MAARALRRGFVASASAAGRQASRGRAVFSTSSSSSSGGSSGSSGLSIAAWYVSKLETHPLITKALTSGFITLAGDCVCQMVIEGGNFDAFRAFRFFVTGTVLVGPVLHYWYGFLFRRFPPSAGMSSTLSRLACDQLLFAPSFIPAFLGFAFALEGGATKLIHDLPNTLQAEWGNMIVTNWGLWVPAQFINFNFIPGPYQVLFSNCVGVAWNTYLSWKANQ